MPKDITDLESTEDGFTAHVSMPLDDNGYFGRECPGCSRFFKMHAGEYEGLPEGLELTCPYCGRREEHSEFMSNDQRERALAAAQAIGIQFAHQLVNESLGSAVRGNSFMSYTPGDPPPVQQLPTYVEQAVERVVACPTCDLHCAVYGASSYCPACGARPSLNGVRAAIDRARASLRLPELVSAEHRADLEAQGVFEGLAREAIKQVVTLFEVFAQAQFEERVAHADQALRGKGKIFQRLADADRLFEKHLGYSVHGLVEPERWDRLLRTFARRHVLIHRDGLTDATYLARYPDEGLLAGQRLVVDNAEAHQALSDLAVLVEAMAAR